MKEGDKLVCIKDLNKWVYGEGFLKEEIALSMKHDRGEITHKEFKKLTVNLYREKENSLKERNTFTKGKIYTINHVNDSSIDIIDNLGRPENFSILEDGRMSVLASYHYDVHFITIVEARKRKLDDLSDNNFSEFLKRVKKV